MLAKPFSCRGCPLLGDGKGFSLLRGEGKEKVLLVGEALGEEEAKEGKPFVGKTGTFLQRLVSRIKDPRSGQSFDFDRDFWTTNVVRCRPPNNNLSGFWYEREAIERCRHFLLDVIKEKKPSVIVAIGGTAHKALAGEFKDWRGKVVGIDALRGFLFHGPSSIPVIGTYHPSYLTRGNFHLARVAQLDILKAVEVARFGKPVRPARYQLHPSGMDAKRFLDSYEAALTVDPTLPLVFDIETPYSSKAEKDEDPYEFAIEDDISYTVLRISFSFKEDEAITMPWIEPFISISKRLLASLGPKISFNGIAYDIPRLEASGTPVLGDQIDGMHLWKCYEPAFPMSLRFVVSLLLPDADQWKLKVRENEELYSCKDSDYLLRCFNKIKAALEGAGRWEMFQRHFIKCGTTLKRMTLRGVKVDQEARSTARRKIEGWLEEKVKEIQPLVPMELRPKKIFKIGLETLMKKGYRREELVLVPDHLPELPKGKILTDEGLLVSAPKPPKLPKTAKSVRKKKQPPSSSDSLPLPEKTVP